MEKQVKKSPFFAQLLEKQIQNEETVKGGTNGGGITDYSKDAVQCLKYPSDQEEPSYTSYYDKDTSY